MDPRVKKKLKHEENLHSAAVQQGHRYVAVKIISSDFLMWTARYVPLDIVCECV